MNTINRITTWLNTGDNAFGVMVILMAPLFALCFVGMVGA